MDCTEGRSHHEPECSARRADGVAIEADPLDAPRPSWTLVTEHAPFCARTAEDAVFLDRMWLSNGYISGGALVRDLWCSTDGATWELVSDATPYDGYSELAVYRDRLWTVKGSVWSSPDGREWTEMLEKTPFAARGYGELVVFGDEMWQLGRGKDVWHRADGAQWSCACEDAPFGPRYGSAVAAFDGRLWLMGGATEQQSDPPEKRYPAFTNLQRTSGARRMARTGPA